MLSTIVFSTAAVLHPVWGLGNKISLGLTDMPAPEDLLSLLITTINKLQCE